MSASMNWMAWNCEMGWPKAMRCFEYSSAASNAPWAMPAGLRGDADAAAVERGESDFVAFAFVADAIGFGDFAIGEDEFAARGGVDAEFFFFLADLEARRAFFDDQRGDAFFAFRRIGVDVDDGGIGGAAVGDPGFGAVDDVFVALLDGFGLERGGVGAGLRLGERVAADFFAAREGDAGIFFFVRRCRGDGSDRSRANFVRRE